MNAPLRDMGAKPTRPSEERTEELKAGLEDLCAEAAKLIKEADVLFMCTGAGFSADSGLAIYADVAKVEAYKARDMEYSDLCKPHWVRKEPELFWGFWGQCFNDYRDTAPHVGYEIIEGWVEKRFRHSEVAGEIRSLLSSAAAEAAGKEEPATEGAGSATVEPPYKVEGHAGAFFVITSNVDAHHFDWYRAEEIREVHGNVEIYQCAGGPGKKQPCVGLWRAPLDFRYKVDCETMLAPAPEEEEAQEYKEDFPSLPSAKKSAKAKGKAKAKPKAKAAAAEPSDEAPKETKPAVGRVGGSKRTTTLRHMPGQPGEEATVSFGQNHPKCPTCGGPARPAILMFNDGEWIDDEDQDLRHSKWASTVGKVASQRACADEEAPLRVVILEIGAGNNVTTIRSLAEKELGRLLDMRADAKLVRINPDFPCGDGDDFKDKKGSRQDKIVPLMGRGLACIEVINKFLVQMS